MTFLFLLASPSGALGHAALTTSSPADKASVSGPFAGPITLTFSEALQAGSSATLLNSGGSKVMDATVAGVTMTFALAAPLAPGAYTVQWTSVAADKDVARGTLTFAVTQATPAPATPVPTTAAAAATSTPATLVTAAPSPSPGAAASAASAGGTSGSSAGDAVLPIVVALVFVALVGASLLRKRAST